MSDLTKTYSVMVDYILAIVLFIVALVLVVWKHEWPAATFFLVLSLMLGRQADRSLDRLVRKYPQARDYR